jgi:RNA methyltransferase, TrmH family
VRRSLDHIITSDALPPVTRKQAEELRELVREPSLRRETKSFVIEGPHLVERALESSPKSIQKILDGIRKKKIPTQELATALAERISDTRSPQGIFGVVTFDQFRSLLYKTDIIALDHVSDPGNLGTILRTASWFGIEEVVLGPGCADHYSPKVLRSTQGEIFSIKVIRLEDLSQAIKEVKKKGYKILATTLSDSAGSLYKEKFESKNMIVFGSEAHGVHPDTLKEVDSEIIIPRYGAGESLNVAVSVGIVLAELQRKKAK